jgi:hypothetical protein
MALRGVLLSPKMERKSQHVFRSDLAIIEKCRLTNSVKSPARPVNLSFEHRTRRNQAVHNLHRPFKIFLPPLKLPIDERDYQDRTQV